MSEPERVPSSRRVPPLVIPGVVLVVIALLAQDRWALYVGGALLIVASLQWGRSA